MADKARAANGYLIALEGIDGSGKTTIARGLADRLRARGIDPIVTQEPTDSYLGTAVREALSDPDHDPVSEALLFAADHAQHVADLAEPLGNGRTVITDRWSTSWRVYQSLTLTDAFDAETDPRAWLEGVCAPFEWHPDLVLLLDLPVELALERMDDRGQRSEKFEKDAFLKRVRGRYLELAKAEGFERIDAAQEPEAVIEACMEKVTALYEEAIP